MPQLGSQGGAGGCGFWRSTTLAGGDIPGARRQGCRPDEMVLAVDMCFATIFRHIFVDAVRMTTGLLRGVT